MPVEARCFETTALPQVASKPRNMVLLFLKLLLLACFSLLFRNVYDNPEGSAECASSECDSSDSSGPLFGCEALRRATRALTIILVCCDTFRRATGALTALPSALRSFTCYGGSDSLTFTISQRFRHWRHFWLAYVKAVF